MKKLCIIILMAFTACSEEELVTSKLGLDQTMDVSTSNSGADVIVDDETETAGPYPISGLTNPCTNEIIQGSGFYYFITRVVIMYSGPRVLELRHTEVDATLIGNDGANYTFEATSTNHETSPWENDDTLSEAVNTMIQLRKDNELLATLTVNSKLIIDATGVVRLPDGSGVTKLICF